MEHMSPKDRYKIAYVGDGNNITNSWLNLASLIPIELRIGTADDCHPDPEITKLAQANPDSKIVLTADPKEAVADADVIYTDVWASMGQKNQAKEKEKKLKQYQVNSSLLKAASPDAIVLHCLPAERGREITDEVLDSPQSVVFDEAENRLHIQKAIMAFLLK
jgi:ornithine carbamoyltransferase